MTVLEIRTHGVSGTPPHDILAGCPGPVPLGEIYDVPRPQGPGRRFVHRVDSDGVPVPIHDGIDRHYAWAYSWNKLTSGSMTKPLWAVLVPFALVNLAYAMIPVQWAEDSADDHDARSRETTSTRLCRLFIHLLGLTLTILFTLHVAYVVVYLFAYRCVAGSADKCMNALPFIDWFRRESCWLAVIATGVVLSLLVAGAVITKFTTVDSEGTMKEVTDSPASGITDAAIGQSALATEDFVDGNLTAPVLRAVHGIAAPTALVAFLSVMGSGPMWLTGLTIGVFALLAVSVSLIDLCGQDRSTIWLTENPWAVKLIRILGWALAVAAHVGAVVTAALVTAPVYDHATPARPGPLSDGWTPIEITIVAAAILTVLVAVALIRPAAGLRAAARYRNHPVAYRPWLWGFAPLVIVAIAVFIATGFGSGLARVYARIADATIEEPFPRMSFLPSYDLVSTMWGLTGLLVLTTAALVAVGVWTGTIMIQPAPAELLEGQNEGPTTGSYDRNVRIAQIKEHTSTFLGILVTICVISAGVTLWLRLKELTCSFLTESGTYILLGFVLGLGWLIQRAIAKPDGVGRGLGVLWDLASFWPREGHPVVPPSYAATTVKDIVKQVEAIRAGDPALPIVPTMPQVHIVLCGHSQGSVIMYAAALQLARIDQLDRVSLLTYGSPLQWAYGRAFPAFLDFDTHKELMTRLDGRWINLIRPTDPVGGPVLSWSVPRAESRTGIEMLSYTAAGTETASPPDDVHAVDGVLTLDREFWLADPGPGGAVYDYPRAHSNYMREAAWTTAVATLHTYLRDS